MCLPGGASEGAGLRGKVGVWPGFLHFPFSVLLSSALTEPLFLLHPGLPVSWVLSSTENLVSQAGSSTHSNLRRRDLRRNIALIPGLHFSCEIIFITSLPSAFMSIAIEVDLWVILCPGPYIGSDLDLGGLPR